MKKSEPRNPSRKGKEGRIDHPRESRATAMKKRWVARVYWSARRISVRGDKEDTNRQGKGGEGDDSGLILHGKGGKENEM